MATAIRNDIDATSFILEVQLNREDLVADVEKSLKRIRQTADLKGFRKGHAPMSMVRRVYEGQLMAETSQKVINDLIDNYIKENKVRVMGQPELVENENDPEKDADELVFGFKIVHLPDFELRMPDKSVVFEVPELTDIMELAQAELEHRKTTSGVEVETPEHPLDNAIYEVEIREMDENGLELHAEGFVGQTRLALDRVRTEALRNEIRTKRVGDTFVCDYHDLDTFETRELSNKYILGLRNDIADKISPFFQCKVTHYFHIEPAELDADFFYSQFGPEIDTEEKALEMLADGLQWSFVKVYRDARFDEIKRMLIELNHFPYPFEYVRNHLESTKGMPMPDEVYQGLCFRLYWETLESKIVGEYNIQIPEMDLYMAAARQLRAMGIASTAHGEFFDQIQQMLQNQEIKESLEAGEIAYRIAQIVEELVSVVRKPMTYEEAQTWIRDSEPLTVLPPELAPASTYEASADKGIADDIARYGEMLKDAKGPHSEEGSTTNSIADYEEVGTND